MARRAFAAVRFAASLILPPGAVEVLEAIFEAVKAYGRHLDATEHDECVQLCELVQALLFKVTSEKSNGREPTLAWMHQLYDLCDTICEHVYMAESKGKVALFFTALMKRGRVEKLRNEIRSLRNKIEFVDAAPVN
ncbi:unnamed protein product [Globisporangium polare]